MIDISGLDKALVLYELVRNAYPVGFDAIKCDLNFNIDKVREYMASCKPGFMYFDYVNGCPIKIDFSNDEINPRLYDRDHGEGAAAEVIKLIREKNDHQN